MISLQSLSKLGRKVLTIGVSGVTCGGKSSVTRLLKCAFPRATLICQDDFYFANQEQLPSASNGTQFQPNWDSLASIDMVSMMAKIQTTLDLLSKKAVPNESILIIDGFLIFNYPPLAELCDLKYFITLPFEECLARRSKRDYDPPDPPGYFVNIAWPMYLTNLEEMRRMDFASRIHYLNGTLDLQENFHRITSDVQTYLNDM